MPKISVIVPIYNVEKYLKRCMDSLINQTLQDIEIIMVDDESPDKCPQLCDEYARQDNRIKVIHKKNEGLGFARNSGLEIASGEFVTFVDSDDFVDVAMYETLYFMAKKNDFDTVYCGVYFFKDTKHIRPRKEVASFLVFRGRKEVDAFLLDMVGPEPSFKSNIKYLMSSCRAIYSMEVINNQNIKFHSERVFVSEDLLFNMDYLAQAEAVAYHPSYFYYYCNNKISLSHTWKLDKYNLYVSFLLEVKRKLSSYYTNSDYSVNYKRLLFISLIVILKYEISFAKSNGAPIYSVLKNRMQDSFWGELFSSYPYWKLPIKHLVFYLLLKYRFVRIVQLLFRMKLIV
jgi:glycosyltransferase involved in cell wall biosynthesis